MITIMMVYIYSLAGNLVEVKQLEYPTMQQCLNDRRRIGGEIGHPVETECVEAKVNGK